MTDNTDVAVTPAAERLFAPGRKRILTLDGGALRGAASLQFLKEIEAKLRQATGRPELVLADVFDLVVGTSVGSILGTMVALGKSAEEMEAIFDSMAADIFEGRDTMFGVKRYDARRLVNAVRSVVKDLRLGSPELKTGLGVVAKRVDKGSVWLLTNNPRMKYYEDGADWEGNKRYKLENIIRASTAAPLMFTPTRILIHKDRLGVEQWGTFVDGGVSPHNNPSLLALMLAGLPAYRLNWTLSPQDLLIISVGAGMQRVPVDRKERIFTGLGRLFAQVAPNFADDIEEAAFAARALRGMVTDGVLFTLKTMQALSHPRFSWVINSEIDALHDEVLPVTMGLAQQGSSRGALFSFQRYDLPLEVGLVAPDYDIDASHDERRAMHKIDDATLLDAFKRYGAEAARKQVAVADFEGFLP